MNSTLSTPGAIMPPVFQPPLLSFVSDQALSLLLPIIVYWPYSLFFYFLSKVEIPFIERYRIHDPEEMKRNKVSISEVLWGVVFQQALQTILGFLVVAEDELLIDHPAMVDRYANNFASLLSVTGASAVLEQQLGSNLPVLLHGLAYTFYWVLFPAFQFFIAMFILDAYQYFSHRLFHQNTFLYKHIHSYHHRLYVPYAFGALYNHPIEGFVMDSVGASFAFWMSGMGTRGAMVFFSFSTLKTVDDHCGYAFPWDPFQVLFPNNVTYHDIHHQPFGIKKNYSQPFFNWWDRLLGTYIPKEMTFEKMKERRQLKEEQMQTTKISSISEKPNSQVTAAVATTDATATVATAR